MALCDFCFRDKSPLQPVHPRTAVRVCKACSYQIDRVIGFLRHSGITLVQQSEWEAPPTPPVAKKPSKSKVEALGDEKGAGLPDTP